MVSTARRTGTGTGWRVRLAGGLLVVVGLTNALMGVLALTTDAVAVGPAVGGGLLAAGLVTAAAGVLVWRGSRPVATVAFAIVVLLLVLQLGEMLVGEGEGAEPRVAVMLVLLISLGAVVLDSSDRR